MGSRRRLFQGRRLEPDQGRVRGRVVVSTEKGETVMPTDVAIVVSAIVVLFVGFAAVLAFADRYSAPRH